MKKYTVKVYGTFMHEVEIDAPSEDEAIDNVLDDLYGKIDYIDATDIITEEIE